MQTPKIEMIAIGLLIPYAFNNKIHTAEQIDRIANSISQFGFNAPIVCGEDNIILVGHGRFQAAKKLGLKEVPMIRVTNLTEAQKKAYRIIDNKTASDTGYDYGNLQLEMKALEEMKFDVKDFHFEEFKITEESEPEESEEKEETAVGAWLGQINLKVPADVIQDFEADLDQLLRRYDNIVKKVKKTK